MKRIFSWALILIMAAMLLSAQPARAADSAAAMEAYKTVLQNEAAFYDIDDKKDYKLNELRDQSGEPLTVSSFTVVDMDGNGTPEAVLDAGSYNGVVVLHYEDGEVYGFSTSYTYYLSNDGTYNGSLPAWCFSYCKVTSITKESYKVETLARVEADPFKEDDEPFYYIGESKVTEDEHAAFVESLSESRQENEAVWHDFTEEHIVSVFK